MTTRNFVNATLRSPRLRGFAALSGGTLVSQILTLIALPFLSRLYSPADFGVLSLTLAISGIIAPALTLKLDAALVLPRSERQTRAIISAAIAAVVTFSAIWAVTADVLARIIFMRESVPYLGIWVGGISLLTGLFTLFSQIAVRERKYRAVASRTVAQSITTSGVQIGLGILGVLRVGLLVGTLLGRLAGLLGLIMIGKRYLGGHRLTESWRALSEYWRFPVIFAPSAVLNSLGLQLPLIVMTAVYGVELGGQLGMAERIVAVPITIVGGAIGQVFLGELSALRRANSHGSMRLFLIFSLTLGVTALVGIGTLALIAPTFVPWALGSDWQHAGLLVQILAVTGVCRLIATPLGAVFFVYQRARANVIIDAIRSVLMLSAIVLIVTQTVPALMAAWSLYGVLALVYVVTWAYIFGLMRRVSVVESNAL